MAISTQIPAQTSSPDQLDWLLGKWERSGEQPGTTAFEKWEMTKTGELKGIGVTMKGADTTFVERLAIREIEAKLYYVAEVAHNDAPTLFEITELTSSGFICENPEHDFPKKIEYRLDGTKLEAIVSGDGRKFSLFFEKKGGQ